MARYGEQVLDKLEKVVERFESNTSVELVVVLARRSSRYLDVPFKVGVIATFVTLIALVYLPVAFMPDLILLDAALAFSLGYVVGLTSPFLKRALTTRKRRAATVRRAAEAAFTSQGISMTRERTGLLLYVSWHERQIELLWDVGIGRCVPVPEWNAARRKMDEVQPFKGFPDSLGPLLQPVNEVLARHLPRPEDDVDEIPNRPVVMG